MGYHSWSAGILTCGFEASRGTLLGGQFDWGGRLLKSNGGARSLCMDGNHASECKRKPGFESLMVHHIFLSRGIAQLVEQRSPKPRAEGSNPSAPARVFSKS